MTTDYVAPTFSLRNKQDVKVGTYISQEHGSHDVVVRTVDNSRWNYTYSVEIDGKPVFTVRRSGNGRNLTWRLSTGAYYGGTLEDAVKQGVSSYLSNLKYAEQKNTAVARIKRTFPYEFATEAEALDFAFSNDGSTNVPVVAKYYPNFYVGFWQADDAEFVANSVKNDVEDGGRFTYRVYGRLDPRVVIASLEEIGIQAHFDADYTSAQVYGNTLTGGRHDGALIIGKNGAVHFEAWGNDKSASHYVADVKTVEEAVEVARLWWYQHELESRAASLLEWLEANVPSGVAHYAVEGVKNPLRVLAKQASTVDFNYGR